VIRLFTPDLTPNFVELGVFLFNFLKTIAMLDESRKCTSNLIKNAAPAKIKSIQIYIKQHVFSQLGDLY